MNRLAWLLLLVCTAAFARVQPVELPVETEACCCCESAGACGMPDCAPPPVQASVTLDRPVAERSVSTRRVAEKQSPRREEAFYKPFCPAPVAEPVSFAKDRPAIGTAPPLRVTQCQWLI